MSSKVKPIPEGYHTVTPYLIINEAAKAIEFYKKAFNATEIMRMAGPNGKIMHAEIRIGNSPVMLGDECPEMKALSPKSIGGSPISMHLYVEDVDSLSQQAERAGATIFRPVADQFYGDRTCGLADPFGHHWYIATRKEELTEEELNKRFENMQQQKSQK